MVDRAGAEHQGVDVACASTVTDVQLDGCTTEYADRGPNAFGAGLLDQFGERSPDVGGVAEEAHTLSSSV